MKPRPNEAVTAFCTLVPNAAFLSAALNSHFQRINLPISAIASLPHPSFPTVHLLPAIESEESTQITLLVEAKNPDALLANTLLNPDFYALLEPKLLATESGFLPMECLITALICHSITLEYLKNQNAPAAVMQSVQIAHTQHAWFDSYSGSLPLKDTLDAFVDSLLARGLRGLCQQKKR